LPWIVLGEVDRDAAASGAAQTEVVIEPVAPSVAEVPMHGDGIALNRIDDDVAPGEGRIDLDVLRVCSPSRGRRAEGQRKNSDRFHVTLLRLASVPVSGYVNSAGSSDRSSFRSEILYITTLATTNCFLF
jgi:hypothetical protein